MPDLVQDLQTRRGLVPRTILVYEAHADEYLRQWGKRRYRRPPFMKEWVKKLPVGARVLDLGCGPGQDARYLRQQHYRVVGLDRARPFLTHVRRRSGRLPLVQADLRRLPFRPQAFDGVWAAASLIHLQKQDVRRTLRELHGLVCPGGLLAATFVHGPVTGVLRHGWLPGRYVSRWLKPELDRTIRFAGWEILSLRTVTNRERKGRWLNLLARRLGLRQQGARVLSATAAPMRALRSSSPLSPLPASGPTRPRRAGIPGARRPRRDPGSR